MPAERFTSNTFIAASRKSAAAKLPALVGAFSTWARVAILSFGGPCCPDRGDASHSSQPPHASQPSLGSLALALAAFIAIFRIKVGMIPVFSASSLAGGAYFAVTGMI